MVAKIYEKKRKTFCPGKAEAVESKKLVIEDRNVFSRTYCLSLTLSFLQKNQRMLVNPVKRKSGGCQAKGSFDGIEFLKSNRRQPK